MAAQGLELKSEKTTAEIEALDGPLDIQLPLTLAGWSLVELANDGDLVAVVRSADGDVFTGTISDVDEGKYILTVELS